jgi:uncharacterized protein
MSDKLPDLIDPLLLAERRALLSGALKLGVFERLAKLVVNPEAVVEIELDFSKQGKQALLVGRIRSDFELECQSCLQGLPWSVDISCKLGVVATLQEADRLAIDCEPLLFNGEKISLNELIEDEILLALPDYPKHEFDCMRQRSSKDRNFDEIEPGKANNPFSVLAKLKNTGE